MAPVGEGRGGVAALTIEVASLRPSEAQGMAFPWLQQGIGSMAGLVGRAVSSGSGSGAGCWLVVCYCDCELGLGVEWGDHRAHRVPAEI